MGLASFCLSLKETIQGAGMGKIGARKFIMLGEASVSPPKPKLRYRSDLSQHTTKPSLVQAKLSGIRHQIPRNYFGRFRHFRGKNSPTAIKHSSC
jgi:hypothetical protein